MRGLGTRSGLIAVIVTGIVAAGLVAAFLVVEWVTRPSVTPLQPTADGAINPSKRPIVVGTTSGAMGDLRVSIDGTDVTDKVAGAGDGIVVDAPKLADGPHTMAVSYSASNLFSSGASAEWTFTVDRTPPPLKVTVPVGSGVNTHDVQFAGTTQPGSIVRVSWKRGSEAVAADAATGAWSVRMSLPDGRVPVRFTATDEAGNSTTKKRVLIVDTKAPTLTISGEKRLARLTTTAAPVIYGKVTGDAPRDLLFGAKINGHQIPVLRGKDAVGGKTATSRALGADAESGPTLTIKGRNFILAPGKLAEGKNTVSVWVRDPGGNVARQEFTSFVDSSSEFGSQQLVEGAVGADVDQLQERLGEIGVWKGGATGTYDAKTIAAVKKYQRKYKLKENGQVDARTLRAIVGRITINLSTRTLTLERNGKKVKTYRVAIGQSAYPTPTGDYKIVNKQKNPKWIPPNSPWAKGLGEIPAGPGNPLGTRWIGTSAPAVGIHGTYADWSVGTAASHGCLRMHIPDVEELYEKVAVGMPVEINP